MNFKTTQFINKAKLKHGDRYNYSNVKYISPSTKVEIICPEHGSFWQLPGNHLYSKSKCPACSLRAQGMSRRSNKDKFIAKALMKHGERYDYSQVEYTKSSNVVKIICPDHGEFLQSPNNHLNGQGCYKCGMINLAKNARLNVDEFISRSNKIHNKKYDYSAINYINNITKIKIICPDHGEFLQSPSSHMTGSGCPKCGIKKRIKSLETFICESNEIHDNKYNYINTAYEHSMQKVEIICPDHGEFWCSPSSHVNDKTGCPKCAGVISKVESDIINWIKSVYDGEVIRGDRNQISPYELDIYLPHFNLAIELCGVYWHSEKFKKDKKYHFNKFKMSSDKGIQLLTIFDSEWINKEDIIKSIISNKLQLNSQKIFARKCIIKEINSKQANTFFNANHIQGSTARNLLNVGLFYDDQLVSCMTIAMHPRTQEAVLARYASILNTNVVGGANKLLKHCLKYYPRLVSWSDNRWSTGALYTRLGFKHDSDIPPGYYYTKGQKIFPAISMQKKKIGCPPDIKEHLFLRERGYYRLWDCGKMRWVIN